MPSILTRPSGGGAGGASVAVALSDTTPKLGQSVTITATATGITPTSYTFYLPQEDGSFETVTQAGNTYAWTVSKYGNFTVTVTATDGSSEGSGSATGTTTGDVDADAFITAHNTATGGTMDSTMEANTLGFFLRLKGINTTYNENVFAQLLAANAELYPMIPDDVSNASIAGYSINAIDPTRNATMVGFVSGDATVNGLTGGAGKYMIMNNAPSDYDADDVGVHVYSTGNTANNTYHIGSKDATLSYVAIGASNFGRGIYLANQGAIVPLSPSVSDVGFLTVQKNDACDNVLYERNACVSAINTSSPTTPSAEVYFGLALNDTGSATSFLTTAVTMLCNCNYLTEEKLITLREAVIWLQTQIGRNV